MQLFVGNQDESNAKLQKFSFNFSTGFNEAWRTESDIYSQKSLITTVK